MQMARKIPMQGVSHNNRPALEIRAVAESEVWD